VDCFLPVASAVNTVLSIDISHNVVVGAEATMFARPSVTEM
jgi:uncharacterized protein (DUF2062 family)